MNQDLIWLTNLICQAGEISARTLVESPDQEITLARNFVIYFAYAKNVPADELAIYFAKTVTGVYAAVFMIDALMAESSLAGQLDLLRRTVQSKYAQWKGTVCIS